MVVGSLKILREGLMEAIYCGIRNGLFWVGDVAFQPFVWLTNWIIFWRNYAEERWIRPALKKYVPAWITPNAITGSRMLFPIPICYFIFWDFNFWLAFLFYLSACLTDLFDGMLARAREETSDLGKMLDPLADKVLKCTIFILLIYTSLPKNCTIGELFTLINTVLIFNVAIDFFNTASAIALSLIKRKIPGANNYGKAKFTFQCIGVFFVIIQRSGAMSTDWPATIAFILAVVYGIRSAIGYFRHFFVLRP